jgi:hypothetical protein
MYANTPRHDPDPKPPEAEAPSDDQREDKTASDAEQADETYRITDWASL